MSDIGAVTVALAAGMALGAIFFGGLRWTVRRGVHAANPGLWFGVSALLRMAIVVSGFYFVARLGWPRRGGGAIFDLVLPPISIIAAVSRVYS